METKELPQLFPRRGEVIQKLATLEYYVQTKAMLENVEQQIKLLSDSVNDDTKTFTNPRQEAIFLHDKKTLDVLTQQQKRLKDKLVELEALIRKHMDEEK